MNLKELKELILFLKEEGITEFELERGDVKVRVKRGGDTVVAPPPDPRYYAVPTAPPAGSGPGRSSRCFGRPTATYARA